MNRRQLFDLAESIIQGDNPDIETYNALAKMPASEAFAMFSGADMIRETRFGKAIHLCMICNGKSGKCSENCGFCAQAAGAKTDAPVYPLLPVEKLRQGGTFAAGNPINRYSVVTSGKRLPAKEVAIIAEAMAGLDRTRIATCVSLGVLDPEDFNLLKKAGVSRYHHNLETSRSHFDKICTSHSYGERIETIRAAQSAGFAICSGGVFGLGETDEQILELALELKGLDVDAVPINFLVPIKGTPIENADFLTPLRCLKIIAMFRYVLPDKDILICGGREANLGELAPLVFYAGASGIMTGDYLTTAGRTLEKDLEMIERLGMTARKSMS